MCKKEQLPISDDAFAYVKSLDKMDEATQFAEIEKYADYLNLTVDVWLRGNMTYTPNVSIYAHQYMVSYLKRDPENWTDEVAEWYIDIINEIQDDREHNNAHQLKNVIINSADVSMYKIYFTFGVDDNRLAFAGDKVSVTETWLNEKIHGIALDREFM